MARKRQIDPVYPLEQEIAKLSIPARYFYILSWCHMDDETGVLPYDIFMLKGQIFPADNIDVGAIIQEIIMMRRYFLFEAEGKRWLWCPTMPKHQTINHPSKRKYPSPPKTLQEDYCSGKLALPLSRVELSRVELSRVEKKKQPYWAAFKESSQKQLKTVSKDFNIYQFMGRLKKLKKIEIPEEVLDKICTSYLKNKAGIKADWPWFIVTTQKEWESWNAEQQIKQGQEWKKVPIAPVIAQILAGIVNKAQK